MSYFRSLLITFVCFHVVCINAALYGILGAAVTANTKTTIVFNSGVAGILESTLEVTASVDCSVSLDFYIGTNIQASLPNGTTGGAAFQLNAGFVLAATNNAVLTTPKLTTPGLSTTLAAAITGTVHAGVLQLNTNTNAFTRVAIDSYDVTSKSITVTLPGVGTYVFVSINEVVSYPYAATAVAFAESNRTIQFGSDVAIYFRSKSANTVTVVKSSVTTKPANITLGVNLGVFLQISLGQSQAHDSVIKYTYTDAQLVAAGLEASTAVAAKLRFAYYSDAQAQWVIPPGDYSVDTTTRVVTQSTTTFSEWGIYYNSAGSLRYSWLSILAVIVPFFLKF